MIEVNNQPYFIRGKYVNIDDGSPYIVTMNFLDGTMEENLERVKRALDDFVIEFQNKGIIVGYYEVSVENNTGKIYMELGNVTEDNSYIINEVILFTQNNIKNVNKVSINDELQSVESKNTIWFIMAIISIFIVVGVWILVSDYNDRQRKEPIDAVIVSMEPISISYEYNGDVYITEVDYYASTMHEGQVLKIYVDPHNPGVISQDHTVIALITIIGGILAEIIALWMARTPSIVVRR